ncbi:hypothetical protein GGF42_001998, partial [Coemansia sp. RSA 2424]
PSEPNEAALLPAANGTSELQQQPQPQARASVRFDPLAQLLGSDTEEDSTDAVGDSDSEIGDKENSPVGCPSVPLSAAHTGILDAHTTTTTTDEEEEEEGPRTMSSLRLDSGSDSESQLLPPVTFKAPSPPAADTSSRPKKPRAPRKGKTTVTGENGAEPRERPASKAALTKIHQETERLVRETAVLINPLDYTQRLVLADFFARFDHYIAANTTAAAATAAISMPEEALGSQTELKPANLPQHTFHYESDSGDYEVEIVDDDIAPLSLGPSTLSPLHSKSPAASLNPRRSNKADLDSILDYASQPLHSSSSSAAGCRRPPTDGPMGLKELNGALMRAMYKQDEEALKATASSRDVAATVDLVKSEEQDEGSGCEDDDECSGESGEDDGNDSGDDDGEAGSGSEGELEDIDDIPSPRIRRRPAAVISDDDDEDEDEPVAPAARPLLEPERKARQPARDGSAGVDSSNKDKAKFLGMFKMPAAKNTAAAAMHQARPAALSPPHLASTETASPAPHQSSFPEIPVSASQDLSYLFPSQYGMVSDTQDSLLLTPAEDMRGGGGGRQYDSVMDTQMSSVGHLESFPEYLVTQPTQMMDDDDDDEEVGRVQVAAQVTQPTQLTVATGSDADDSALPSMVRQALASGVSSDLEEPVEDASSASSNGGDGEERGISSMVADSHMSPPKAPAGRLLRRGDVVAQRKKKRRNAKRSEFVEAEAEVGDSSDSDGEAKGAVPRKFNWGGEGPGAPKPVDESDEDEDDMDSEEEEAALLADPMINNEVDENESEGDEAIRELHRQRDFDEDEHNIQTLYNDITTGALKNRVSRNRTGFALADEEDYNDRQTRAERMEERARMRRKLLAREIHDKDLAEIAKNPETAAFARAALMRPPPPPSSALGSSSSGTAVGDPDGDEMLMLPGDDAFELEEIVDDRHVAMAVQQQLMRTRMRVDSDDDEDMSAPLSRHATAGGSRIGGGRLLGPSSSQTSAKTDSLPLDDEDGDAFSSVSVEKLIVRRRTLLASGKEDSVFSANGSRASSLLLKRPGTALLSAAAKRLNVSSGSKKTI